MTDPGGRPTGDFVFEVGGITVTFSILVDDVPTILAWSTSEVILHLGSEGPLLQAGLRELFGS